jgi:hypothetical protein
MSQGLEWFLQLGLPTAATILEMQNVKRRIPEIGEIDQALRALRHGRSAGGSEPRTADQRARPFAD